MISVKKDSMDSHRRKGGKHLLILLLMQAVHCVTAIRSSG